MKKNSYILSILFLILIVLVFSGCNTKNIVVSKDYYDVFGTYLSIGLIVNNNKEEQALSDIEKVCELLRTLESKISSNELRYPNSDIVKLNKAEKNEKIALNEETSELLLLCKQLYHETEGAFDPSVFYLIDFWSFSNNNSNISVKSPNPVSDTENNDALMATINFDAFVVEGNKAWKTADKVKYNDLLLPLKLDLGAIGKGFAVDKAIELLRNLQYEYGYISLGGSSISVMKNPQNKNNEYDIQLIDPRSEETNSIYYANLTLSDKTISSSGDYQKYFIADDKRFCHIINPYKGKPIDNGTIMTSIVCDSAAIGDALTTAFMILDDNKISELLKKEFFIPYNIQFASVCGDKPIYEVKGNLKINITNNNFKHI